MTPGPTPRRLTATEAGADESVLDLLVPLRAALSGSGPALLLHGRGERPAGDGIELSSDDDDPADPTTVAVTTSGSTGAAKTVLLTASALLASAGATHDRLGGSGHWLLALPAQHVAGLQVLVRSLIAGTRPTVLDLNTGFTPEGFTAAAEQVGAARPGSRRYTSLVPTQLTRLLTAPGPTGARALEALRRFDAILIGGAATSPALLEQARAAGVRLVTTYGMSETCGGCVYDGVPLDGVTVHLDSNPDPTPNRDPDSDPNRDRTRAPDVTSAPTSGIGARPAAGAGPGAHPRADHARLHASGRVHLGGPMVARGYLLPAATGSAGSALSAASAGSASPAASAASAASAGSDSSAALAAQLDSPFSIAPEGVRWFRTDDAGIWDGTRLRILGRLDSMIISGGVNISPAAVEAALQRLPGVAEAVVVGLPDAEWGQRVAAALVLLPGATAPTLAAARALVRAEVSGPAAPRQLTVLDALPLRGPGKPDRAAIEKALTQQPPVEGL